MLKLCNIFIFLLSLFSCAVVDFNVMEIKSNINDENIFFNREYIELNFSIPVNEQSLKDNLSLKMNNSIIEYELFMSGNKVCIKPKDNWTKNQDYKISITGNISSKNNSFFEVNFQKNFTYGFENDLFLLVEIILPDEKTNTDFIKLTFNKSINLESFESEFSISPYIQTKKDYSGNTVIIRPQDKWNTNQPYTWKISELKSEDNTIISKSYSETFIYKNDNQLPELSSLYIINIDRSDIYNSELSDIELADQEINNLKINNGLGFKFNKKINASLFSNYFSITPSVKGKIYENENLIYFIPDENFSIDTKYEITISENLKDNSGLSPFSSYKYYFTPLNNYLEISSVLINDSTQIPLTTSLNNETTINKVNISQIGKAFIKVTFNYPLNIKTLSNLEKAVSISPFLPVNTSTPHLTAISVSESHKSVIFEFDNFTTDDSDLIIYKISLQSSSLKSENDEYLKEDLCALIYSN